MNDLSPREKLVLTYAARGWTAPEMAGRLHLATSTVKTQRENACRKLHARNITHAVMIALRSGIVRFEDIDDIDGMHNGHYPERVEKEAR